MCDGEDYAATFEINTIVTNDYAKWRPQSVDCATVRVRLGLRFSLHAAQGAVGVIAWHQV
jgi:hypothetical protein